MRYFLDTEFSENGPGKPIELISVSLVSEGGAGVYLISSEFNEDNCNDWVKANVLPKLGHATRCTLKEMADVIQSLIGYGDPEFWGYYCDYDWVVFCQIFGSMVNLPKGWPKYCHDIKQLADQLGNPPLPQQGKGEHNALDDALWNKTAYEFLIDLRQHAQDGTALIAAERQRQIDVEGFKSEHDDMHTSGELAAAAGCYASFAAAQALYSKGINFSTRTPIHWPWEETWWKPDSNPIRNLEKAGALIAAEIDRLQRIKN